MLSIEDIKKKVERYEKMSKNDDDEFHHKAEALREVLVGEY